MKTLSLKVDRDRGMTDENRTKFPCIAVVFLFERLISVFSFSLGPLTTSSATASSRLL